MSTTAFEQRNTEDQPAAAAEAEHLSDVIARCVGDGLDERITVGAIAGRLGDRSIGALLLLLSLPMALPVPAPGLSTAFGVPLIIVSGQLAIRRRQAWLPAALARRSVSRAALVALIAQAVPRLRRLERLVRPRMEWMATEWAAMPIGLLCGVLAVIIALPIPFGNVVPGVAIALLALGVLEHDGLVVAVGGCVAALALALVTMASAGAFVAISQLLPV